MNLKKTEDKTTRSTFQVLCHYLTNETLNIGTLSSPIQTPHLYMFYRENKKKENVIFAVSSGMSCSELLKPYADNNFPHKVALLLLDDNLQPKTVLGTDLQRSFRITIQSTGLVKDSAPILNCFPVKKPCILATTQSYITFHQALTFEVYNTLLEYLAFQFDGKTKRGGKHCQYMSSSHSVVEGVELSNCLDTLIKKLNEDYASGTCDWELWHPDVNKLILAPECKLRYQNAEVHLEATNCYGNFQDISLFSKIKDLLKEAGTPVIEAKTPVTEDLLKNIEFGFRVLGDEKPWCFAPLLSCIICRSASSITESSNRISCLS